MLNPFFLAYICHVRAASLNRFSSLNSVGAATVYSEMEAENPWLIYESNSSLYLSGSIPHLRNGSIRRSRLTLALAIM